MRERNVFVSVFWGDVYVLTFLRIALPSILSKRNLEALTSLSYPEYLIYTLEPHVLTLDRDPLIQELRRYFPVRIQTLKVGTYERHPHQMTRVAHIETIRYAAIQSAAIWFLQAECIFGDGALEVIRDAAQDGKYAYLTFAPRVNAKALELIKSNPTHLEELSRSRLTLSFRELGQLSMLAPSDQTARIHYPGSPLLYNWPAIIIWRLGQNATLTRGVHMCPIYLDPDTYTTDFKYCIDGDLVPSAIHDWRRVHLPINSDEFAMLSFSPDEPVGVPTIEDKPLDIRFIARWMSEYAGEFERTLFFNKPVLFHDGSDLSGYSDKLMAIEEEVDKLRHEVRKYRSL